LRGPRQIFLGTTGFASILFNGGLIEGNERAALTIATVPPGKLVFNGTRIRHRPRSTGVVPSDVNVTNDQGCVVMVSNSSGSAACPNAIVDLIDCTIDGARPNLNGSYHGVQINQAFFPSNSGYLNRVRLVNPRFIGDYTARISHKAGLVTLIGGDLGVGRGGGIIYSTDHQTVAGFNNPYSAALDIQRVPARGNAAYLLSAAISAGANVDSRYFLRMTGTIPEADNLYAAVISGTVVKLEIDAVVMSDTAPASATNKGGFAGMRWTKRVPLATEDRYYECTTGHATAATWSGPLTGSATWDPASVADGAQVTTTVTVTGAALGDFLERISFSNSLGGLVLSGYVSATDTVTAVLSNASGGAVDLASGTVKAVVRK
jgi:hypothetical protein